MKSEQIVIDVEVVKDWNWVKCGVKEGYYRVRNWWWDVKYGVSKKVTSVIFKWGLVWLAAIILLVQENYFILMNLLGFCGGVVFFKYFLDMFDFED